MKIFLTWSLVFITSNCFASSVLNGVIVDSVFSKAIGKKCSIVLKVIAPQGASTIAYNAKIRMNVPTRYVKKLQINDLTAHTDNTSRGKTNVLSGLGSLHKREISQRLFVYFNNENKAEKYAYRDGTRSLFGEFTYVCALNH